MLLSLLRGGQCRLLSTSLSLSRPLRHKCHKYGKPISACQRRRHRRRRHMLSCVATAVKFAARPEEPPEPGRNLARKTKEEEQDGDGDGDEERWLGGYHHHATAAGGLIYRWISTQRLRIGVGLEFRFRTGDANNFYFGYVKESPRQRGLPAASPSSSVLTRAVKTREARRHNLLPNARNLELDTHC